MTKRLDPMQRTPAIEKGAHRLNIGIFGVGGVGGYFGAKICRAREALQANVYFVARGAHGDAIRKNGLTVRTSSEGILHCQPTLVTADVDELPSLDACLVCVKSYDLEDLAQRLNPLVSDTTEVVPVLNGIDIRDRIRKKLLGATIYPACVFIGTHIEEPGVISQDGGACRILFGKASPETGRDASVMAEVFDKSLIKSEWHDDIVPSLWTKYIFIAPFSLVTACYDKTLGQVMESEELSSLVRALMNEVLALAAAQHIPLPVSIIEDSYRKGKDFPSGTKTSFQRDYEVPDRPDERDLFGGAIIRLGKRLDIATPCASGVYETINRTKKPVTRRPQAPAGKSEPI